MNGMSVMNTAPRIEIPAMMSAPGPRSHWVELLAERHS